MAQGSFPSSLDYAIYEVIQNNSTWGRTRISREVGCSEKRIRTFRSKYGRHGQNFPSPDLQANDQDDTEASIDIRQSTGLVTTKSTKIKTVEQALAYAKIDLDTWEVDRQVVNFWDTTMQGADKVPQTVTNYQVKVWLKRQASMPLLEAFKDIMAEMPTVMPIPPALPPIPDGEQDKYLLEISLVDHHFGKLAWEPETGSRYDLKVAEKLFDAAVATFLKDTENYPLDKILLPVGNDFFHINSRENTTVHGTRQDVDSRLHKIFTAGCRAMVNAITRCRMIAPTKVIWVPGNHDMDTSWFMMQYLQGVFRGGYPGHYRHIFYSS